MEGKFTESAVEEAALEWLEAKGWTILHGPEIAAGTPSAERCDPDFRDVILERRLRQALQRLNANLPSEAIESAMRKLAAVDGTSLLERNRMAWKMIIDGVGVEYTRTDGSIAGYPAAVIDFDDPENNDWAAVNQFTVREGQHVRRPDIVLFLNGLPIAGIELKNATDEQATIWTAYDQYQTYKHQIPSLYVHNALLAISDGLEARVGSITSPPERFMQWRAIDSEKPAPATVPQLRVLIEGLFDKRRLLDFLRYFIVFEEEKTGTVKKIAGYHQFHAVNRAIEATAEATDTRGDKRAGVVWHTQGSGKSLTMVFYAGRLALDERFKNPTIVVLTDRNDLDDQLFGTFSRCHETLRQPPVQAESREHLRQLLSVSSGGIVFTTIQKFVPAEGERHPELTDRRNVIVIADEAHRSQYDFIDGFARHMRDALPGATFIGFTGTPIERTDASTTAVFGDTISVYDIQRAVEDKATVPIYYENRLVNGRRRRSSSAPMIFNPGGNSCRTQVTKFIQRKAHRVSGWRALGENFSVGQFSFQLCGWQRARHFAVVREGDCGGTKARKLIDVPGYTFRASRSDAEEEIWRDQIRDEAPLRNSRSFQRGPAELNLQNSTDTSRPFYGQVVFPNAS